jgi:uncharacterized protein DUF6527
MTKGRRLTQIDHTATRRLARLLRTLPGIRSLPWRYRVIGVVEAADELPATLLPRSATLVGSFDKAKWIAFDCPKHRTERILLNLSAARSPRWNIADQQLLTIKPSIDALHRESRCHFLIRRGRITWVPDRTPRTAGR